MLDFAARMVDTRAEQALSLDPASIELLVKTSETIGGIVPLTDDNAISGHERGFFAVDSDEVVGYAAHKTTEGNTAEVGSVVAMRTGNGRGSHLAHLLVATTTLAAFENPDVERTEAWCTDKSFEIFARLGYTATGDTKIGSCGQEKRQVRLSRERFDEQGLLFAGTISLRSSMGLLEPHQQERVAA